MAWVGGEVDLYLLVLARGHLHAGEVGLDGERTVAAVDEGDEFYGCGTALVEYFVEGGANGAASEEDVVCEEDVGSVHVEGQVFGVLNLVQGIGVGVVAVEYGIHDADRTGLSCEIAKVFAEALGKYDAAACDADDGEIWGVTHGGMDAFSQLMNGLIQVSKAGVGAWFHGHS